jgi:hypothetical protein
LRALVPFLAGAFTRALTAGILTAFFFKPLAPLVAAFLAGDLAA